jgi:ribosomal protein S18 acetylase RimI-like enzyme
MSHFPPLKFRKATLHDAGILSTLYSAVADDLSRRHGQGHWSAPTSEQRILENLSTSEVIVAEMDAVIVGTLRLATKKPWAIDASYFTPCRTPLYLLQMAVAPDRQKRGLGRRCLDEAARIARQRPADAIRLDAYDHAAGAGRFYEKCGYTEVGRATFRNTPLIYYELML